MTERSASDTSAASVVVIGDGWAALGAVSRLIQGGSVSSPTNCKEVIWVSGTGNRMLPPLPGLQSGPGARAWRAVASGFGIELGTENEGSFIREFRNKAFRQPGWVQAPTPENRVQVREELLWRPEEAFAGTFETRFDLSLFEIEEKIREKLLAPLSGTEEVSATDAPAASPRPTLTRIEGDPLAELKFIEGHIVATVLGSGRELKCQAVVYADSWSELSAIQGLPKGGLGFTRRRSPVGILQAQLLHETPVATDVLEGFFGALHRESGEQRDSRVWGCFSADGTRSLWTLILSAEQVEDNHEIAKKLRRMKSALEKMFVGGTWVPEGKAGFLANVRGEQVRFSERLLFSEGAEVLEPVELPDHAGLSFLTDGCGPSAAFQQVAALTGDAFASPFLAIEPTASEISSEPPTS